MIATRSGSVGTRAAYPSASAHDPRWEPLPRLRRPGGRGRGRRRPLLGRHATPLALGDARQRTASQAALVGPARPRLRRDLRPARRRHALAALAARDRARAVRLGRRAAGAARAREPRLGHRLRRRALRVRLRLPRSLRGQVAELRRARPRLREDDHAAPHLAPLRPGNRGVRVRRRRRRLRGRLPHRVLRGGRSRGSRVRLRGDAARALRLVARRRRAAALAGQRPRAARHDVPAARAHARPRLAAALRRTRCRRSSRARPASRACTRSRSAT